MMSRNSSESSVYDNRSYLSGLSGKPNYDSEVSSVTSGDGEMDWRSISIGSTENNDINDIPIQNQDVALGDGEVALGNSIPMDAVQLGFGSRRMKKKSVKKSLKKKRSVKKSLKKKRSVKKSLKKKRSVKKKRSGGRKNKK
jgi:hypothetical protein